jgi:hypothetical protein
MSALDIPPDLLYDDDDGLRLPAHPLVRAGSDGTGGICIPVPCSSKVTVAAPERVCLLCGWKYRVAVSTPSKVSPTQAERAADGANLQCASSPVTGEMTCAKSSGIFRCTRCGLTTSYDVVDSDTSRSQLSMQTPAQSSIMEAARAYRFMLLAETTPLLKDLANLVIDYLIWFRSDTDFSVGNLVDARDLRGKWLLARVEAIERGKLLIHYIGFSKKWDQWISSQSDRLAPCHTKTKSDSEKLRSTLHWTSKESATSGLAAVPPVHWQPVDPVPSLACLSSIPHQASSSPSSQLSLGAANSTRMPSNYGASGALGHAGNELEEAMLGFAKTDAFANGPSSIPPMPIRSVGPPKSFTTPLAVAAAAPALAQSAFLFGSTASMVSDYDQMIRPSPSIFIPSPTPTRSVSDESEAEANRSPSLSHGQ